MKKSVICLLILSTFFTASCAYKQNDSGQEIQSNTDIASDSNETAELNFEYISDDGLNYFSSSDAKALYETSDYVVVAKPTEDFVDSESCQYIAGTEPAPSFEQADMIYSFTKRKFKVFKVYKGEDKDIKEIIVGENAITDGKTVKIWNGEYIAEKNNKYLLFLKESNVIDGLYFPEYYQGKYDLKASNNDGNKHINQQMLKQVKELYKDDFE